MKRNTTTLWFVLAALLATGIWVLNHTRPAAAPANPGLLSGFRAADVTALEIIPAGERKISLILTNKTWRLQEPVVYPAQNATVEALLGALEKLKPSLRLTAADMQSHKNADAEFGFENPQFTLDLTAGTQSWHLRVGGRTAPGDGVYVRLVGSPDAFVTGVDWLQYLPPETVAWRDTSLVSASGSPDWIVITNGAKVIELRRDPTNHLWRMTRPLPARADNTFIAGALERLRTAAAARFVTDDPKADLTTYGLQPAELEVCLGAGTNVTDAVDAGKQTPDNKNQIFARRVGWNSIFTVDKEFLQPWRGDVNDFRDPHLLSFPAAITNLEVQGDNHFTLQIVSNRWQIAGETFPVDFENVRQYVRLLASLRISEFVKSVATETDLEGFGFTTNQRSITLRFADGTTNAVLFGAAETNRVLVKRSDEVFVYALSPADVARLPENGWEFRDRQLWNFSVTNLAQITLKQGGRTRQILRTGPGHWALAPGSQGMVDPVGLEESANQLSTLTAAGWVGRNITAPEKYGLSTNNLEITLELKTGEKYTVDFGAELASQTALAAATLDGERWAFVFPPTVFQLVTAYLTIPPGTP